jgi:hypothetical protein
MFVVSDGGVCFGSSGSSNRNLFSNKPKKVKQWWPLALPFAND